MSLNVRRRLLIDRRLQMAIARRGLLYWCFCVVSLGCSILCWWMVSNPNLIVSTGSVALWYAFGPPLVACLLLAPVVVFDAIRISNKIAGPMFRLRRAMNALANGEHVEPLEFRKGDLWGEILEDFNRTLERVNPTSQDESSNVPVLAFHEGDEVNEDQLEAALEHALSE